MWNVLIADTLLALQVIGILNQPTPSELRERRHSAVCICQRLRICIRGKQVEAIAETPLDLSEQGVVAGLTDVFQAAVGVNESVLGEWTQRLTDAARKPDKWWVYPQSCSSGAIYVLTQVSPQRKEL